MEASGPGACCKFVDQLLQAAGVLDRVPFDSFVGNESARTLLRIEDASNFHFAIGTRHGVGVDLQVDGYLADGWQLIPGNQDSRSLSGLHLIDELAIERNAAVHVQAEGE